MARRFPKLSPASSLQCPRFSPEQIAFLEDIFMNKACAPAMLNSLTNPDGDQCMACAARVEDLVNTIRSLRQE